MTEDTPKVSDHPNTAAPSVTTTDAGTKKTDVGSGLEEKARSVVDTYAKWSVAAGLIPLPFVDMVAVTGIQIKMLRDLAELYKQPFAESQTKAVVASLLGSIAPQTLASGGVGSMLKAIPVFGPALGVLAMPAFSSAATYAIGKVFIQHFETGGTLLDFDTEKMRAHFRKEFEAEAGRTGTASPTPPAASNAST